MPFLTSPMPCGGPRTQDHAGLCRVHYRKHVYSTLVNALDIFTHDFLDLKDAETTMKGSLNWPENSNRTET